MNIFEAIVIAIVEGLTEFLPISSTAHMRIVEKLMGMNMENDFTKLYSIAIQLGAILSVVVLYWKKFFDFKNYNFYFKLLVAFVPAIIVGVLLNDWIDKNLENVTTIAIVLLLGGVLLFFVDGWFNKPNGINDEKQISYKKSFLIGCFQCLAVIFPGLSRSAASIIGGMSLGLTRNAAAEFSFFLAVPTMLGATAKKLLDYFKAHDGFSAEEIKILALGNAVAFIVALLAIKFFIGFLKKYGFKIWGYYRIALGVILLILLFSGYLKN